MDTLSASLDKKELISNAADGQSLAHSLNLTFYKIQSNLHQFSVIFSFIANFD